MNLFIMRVPKSGQLYAASQSPNPNSPLWGEGEVRFVQCSDQQASVFSLPDRAKFWSWGVNT